ncbi:MOSC domain-containing protein [Cryobacterium arcticum]|uniref:Molybdenum cofactor biosysynthesis protein n=1 Tax=Cryobacterium arcticum TaxID=670052 RepID=A0A318A351_9MICO|nr:molybdenum cofactor biosysynthesis protein [Cryobacterium arcticum]PXA72736.1 molybdenum cofactor biosysynthesis protein [Cryobacterium arcticum]
MISLPYGADVEIVLLLASAVHRYEGRPADGPLPAVGEESHASIRLRAGLGIVGDRHFGQRAHVHASVTVMNAAVLEQVADDLGLPRTLAPISTRRNILLRGVDVDALRGAEFSLDTGDGPVRFRANRPANPCAWMDVVLAPGAHRALRGRGGMRCEPLTDGTLRLGPARMLSTVPLSTETPGT